MKTHFSRGWLVLVLGLGLVGCGNDEEEICENLCRGTKNCGFGPASCDDDSIAECKKNLEDVSGDCQDALDEWADCLNDIDSCTIDSIASECASETLAVNDKCEGESGFEDL